MKVDMRKVKDFCENIYLNPDKFVSNESQTFVLSSDKVFNLEISRRRV